MERREVGHGQVRPMEAKVTPVAEFPIPATYKECIDSCEWWVIIKIFVRTFLLLLIR